MTSAAEHSVAPPPSYDEVLEQQQGVIARRQALAGGLSAETWRSRLDRGRWQAVLPGVVVTHTGKLSFLDRVWAGIAFAGAGAALSGDALLHLLTEQRRGSWPAPDLIDVAVPAGCQTGARDFFRPHRVSGLAALLHPARLPPQVRAAPGVLHAAAWAPSDRAAEWRVAAAVQHRLVRVIDLRPALVLLPRLPRRALVRAVLDDVELGAHAQTELDLLALLRRHRLPMPDRLQFKVRANGTRYLDAWWERQRVLVELDGAHHRLVRAWDADTLRLNAIAVSSRQDRVLALRFTGGNLRHDQLQVAAQLRAALL